MLTSFNDDEALFDAVMAGASGYVLKEVRGAELIDSVRSVAAGRSLLDPLATARVLERLRNPPRDALTATLSPQETAILGHLADGLTNRQIADADVPGREDGEELRLQPARQARDDPPHASRRLRRPAGRTRATRWPGADDLGQQGTTSHRQWSASSDQLAGRFVPSW